jgi:uncharacterized protein
MKTTVVYHRADFDGIFCREIARKFLPEAELIGWDHGDPYVTMPQEGLVYILDLSPDCLNASAVETTIWNRIVWIDHHKSSIEKFSRGEFLHAQIPGYRIDGVAACRLAWQWFVRSNGAQEVPPNRGLPGKENFISRQVPEPLAVRLAGEYDIWDKRDPRAELFQHGLRSMELDRSSWNYLLGDMPDSEVFVSALLKRGEAIQYAQTRQNESVIKEIGFTFQWEGLTFIACNAARYNSHLFTAGILPEHDACFGFKWTGKDWSVSLYGVPGKPEVDLSKIAVKYGGGGHKQACGFRTERLPFMA